MNELNQIVFEMLSNLRDGDYKDPGEETKKQVLDYTKNVNQKLQKGENVNKDLLKLLEMVYLMDSYSRDYPEESEWIYNFLEEVSDNIFYGIDY